LDKSKEVFTAQIRLATKVHLAFCKALKKTLVDVQKPIDTTIIGIFKPGDQIKFYPSPEYIEAGRFKQAKWLRQEVEEAESQDYAAFYSSLKAGTDVQTLNFASLATVCDSSADSVKQILVDLFSCLVEVNRKSKKEVKVNFGKQLGCLCLNLSGHLNFETTQNDYGGDTLSFFKPSKSVRDNGSDASTVLDGASAILSGGGGMAFSVKSGFLSNITVDTPKSFFSKRSTHTNIQFSKFRGVGKSNAPSIKTAGDIFEAQS